MTTTATLDHPMIGTVSFPILGEGGDPLISRDFGKPHVEFRKRGRIDPQPTIDAWNNLENYTIQTALVSDSAYADARNLVKICKSMPADQNQNGLTLDIPLSEYPSDVPVVPRAEQEEALTLTYPPGTKNYVEVDLGLTRVADFNGGDAAVTADIPTDTGDGPVQVENGSTAVELSKDLEVERSVGRPNDPVDREYRDHPVATIKRKSAFDLFSLNLKFTEDAPAKVDELSSLFETRLGRETFTLDFNGVYGLGRFDVMPAGSGALRHVRRAGEGDMSVVPQIDLQVVGF